MSNLEIVQSAYQAFGEGDIKTVLAVLDPQVEWIEDDVPGLPYAGTNRGAQAVAERVFAQMPDTYESFELVPEDWIDGGDTIVMLGRVTIAKEGREETMRVAQVWTLRNGKAVRFESFQDTHASARVLGAA
jgi:uncharacterized protein